jgi:hypothetical protein
VSAGSNKGGLLSLKVDLAQTLLPKTTNPEKVEDFVRSEVQQYGRGFISWEVVSVYRNAFNGVFVRGVGIGGRGSSAYSLMDMAFYDASVAAFKSLLVVGFGSGFVCFLLYRIRA